MKLTIYKYLTLLLGLALFSACSDDFLVKVNPNQVATDNFWQNLDDTGKGLNATYSTLRNYFVTTFCEDNCRGDMGWPGYGRPTPTSTSPGLNFYFLTYSDSHVSLLTKWDAYYLGIFRANQVIEALERIKPITLDSVSWKNQMAQARFLRGLFHFYLNNDFNNGNVIIRDKVPESLDDFNKAVSPSADVIKFYRADLRYAYDNLPYSQSDKGRATKGAAATILGTSYLYQNQMDSAKTLFDDVIHNPAYGYKLVTDMTKLFTTAGEFNQESIFEVAYSSTLRPDITVWDESSMSNRLAFYSTNTVACYVPAWLTYAYKTEKMDTLDARNYYANTASSTGKSLRNVPLRASSMVTLVEDTQTPYYLTASVSQNGKFGAANWGIGMYKKYTNHDILSNENLLSRGSLASGKNVTLNRLAEVYLDDAECLIKLNKLDSALILINAIRQRWALVLRGKAPAVSDGHMYDNITYDKTMLMDTLMYVEKPLELSVEGNDSRWNDLRRWGIIKSNYDRLASQTYYAVFYKYVNNLGATVTRGQSSVVKALTTTNNTTTFPAFKIDFEYKIPAANYTPSVHDYYPIPLSETTTNSALGR